jgi:Cell Wall Hydrolase
MIIKRQKPQRSGLETRARTFVLAALALLTMSSVSSVQARYQNIPGTQGKSVTIALDAPTPFKADDGVTFGFAGALGLNDPGLAAPVPLPEMADPNLAYLGIPATPAALPSGTAFVMPTSVNRGTAATPYIFASRSPIDSMRSAICLTSAIYYEAASESDDGQRAVAQVVLNRVRHPAWPNTVCGVVYQGSEKPGCQFSFACDGAMARRPSEAGWARASRIAREALAGFVYTPVGLATFYHTPQVNPSWNKRLITTAVLGNHIFYRMPGAQGAPMAFADRYLGNEPFPAPKPRAYTPPPAAALHSGAPTVPLAPYPGQLTPVPTPGAALPVPMPGAGPYPAQAKPSVAQDERYVRGTLPESDIMPAYRESGTWIKR